MRNFKRVLITGINGSGGSYLAEHILNKKKKLKIFGTHRSNNLKNIETIKNKISIIQCDLNNFSKIKKILTKIKPDVIFHLASNADVRKSFDEPKKMISNNNNITLTLLESLRVLKINPILMICSTSEVYGLVKKKDTPIKENCKIRPANPYAVSKVFQDFVSYNYYLNFGLNIIITRMFSYFNSKRLTLFSSNWINQIVQIEKKKLKVLKHGNLNTVRTILDIDDAMEAYWLAAAKGKIGEIYNIGGGKIIKLSNFLEILKKKSFVKIKTKVDKKLLRKTDVTLQIPDCSKFMKDTGWKPRISFKKSIDNMLNDFRN